MADLYTTGVVTIFGANGTVALSGVIAASAMSSIDFRDDTTVVEQKNGVNKTVGLAAHRFLQDINLRFYPIPLGSADTDFQNINLPAVFSTVRLTRNTPATGPGQLPTEVAGMTGVDYSDYTYMGGGTITLAQEGFAVMTLPCRRYAAITPA
jgi:hypothetical protein